MNYADIKKCDVANGTGVRVSLFVSGCTHQCIGCFNKEAWDFHYGEKFTKEVEDEILDLLDFDYIDGLSLLGGEPLEKENQIHLLPFLKRVKEKYKNKSIWCYSGYTLNDDLTIEKVHIDGVTSELLALIDVLVDGKFVLEKKSLKLRFRGSENQRIIDLKESRKQNKIVLWEDKVIC